MKKWFIRLLLMGVALVLVAGAALWWAAGAARKQLSPEAIVAALEKDHNLRAFIGSTCVTFFPSPATLEITQLHLAPRDESAGKPLAGRPPIDFASTYLKCPSARLETDWWALIRGQVRVKAMVLRGLDVKGDILPNGGNTLAKLATKPPKEKKPQPEVAEEKDEEGPAFDVSMIPLTGRLDRLAIEEARFRLRNKKTKSLTELNDFTLELTDFEVDPNNLKARNSAKTALKSHVLIGKNVEQRYCDLAIEAGGTVIPFDAVTGKVNPDLMLDVVFKKGTWVQGLPALEKLQKNIEKAQRAGLKLRNLSARSELQQDAVLKLKLHDSRVVLRENVTLPFNDYSLALGAQNFIDAAKEVHEFKATLTASEELSQQAITGADQFLNGLGAAGASLRKIFVTPLIRDNRIAIDFVSNGSTDKPDVSVPVVDGWKDSAKDTLGDFLQGVQDSLGGNKKPEPPPQPKAEEAPTPQPSAPTPTQPALEEAEKQRQALKELEKQAKEKLGKKLDGWLEKLEKFKK